MAHIFADNVREDSVTEGTGNFVLRNPIAAPGSVIVGRPFSDVVFNNDTFDYTIAHLTLNQWEIGIGTYLGDNIFARSPTSSSNNGNIVNFSPGVKQVFIAPVAARMSDTISDADLPQVQSGKTFTSTVSITGEMGLRVEYGLDQYAIGQSSGVQSDYANVIRSTQTSSVWYVDTDKLVSGFRVRYHESGDDQYDALHVLPSGTSILGSLTVTAAGEGSIADRPIKTVSPAAFHATVTYPVGHTVIAIRDGNVSRNGSATVRISDQNQQEYSMTGTGDPLTGTWRSRGGTSDFYLMERVA